MSYCIIDTADGWTIVEILLKVTADETAVISGGTVIDPGPFDSYEEANDALLSLQDEFVDDAQNDVPATQALEGRP